MTTNFGFDFVNAKKKYEEAKTSVEKLAALQEMLSHTPTHKGAENLKSDITRKISLLRKEIEKDKEKEKARKSAAPSINVKKEGAGQIVIVGMPNSGKSTLLKKLTGVDVEIAPFPFTTTKPEIGMMNHKGAMIQIVEVPAIIEGSTEGKAGGTQLFSIMRNADAIILIFRGWEEKKILMEEFRKANIKLNEKKPDIQIKPSKFGGITIAGKQFLSVKEDKFIEFLKGIGVANSEVVLNEPVTYEQVAEAVEDKIVYKPAIIIDAFEIEDIENFKKQVFELLNKILVFTKKPGEETMMEKPLVLDRGTTIEEAAKSLHKDFAQNMRYAKVWGSTKFPGQRVAKDYILKDGDIVEIYT